MSLLLVASLLLCCVPALAVPAAAADTEMYLYNGVELPDINSVWTDKVSYPYACIMKSGTLFLTSKPLYCADAGFVWVRYTCDYLSYQVSSGIWQYSAGGTLYSQLMQSSFFSWSSYDVLYESGLTHLASTSPLPVNPPSSIASVSIFSPETVLAGLYIIVSVDVSGTGDFDSSATLTLAGNTSSGTYLEKGDVGNNWTLFCGEDEAASSLTVTAASVQNSSVTASKTITVEHPAVDPTDPTIPSDPDDPDPIDPTVPEETQPGNSGALTDKSGDISDGLCDIHDFEQSQKDVLDNNVDTILLQVDFVNLIPALAFVGGYINKAWLSMSAIQLIFTVPLFLGLFFFLCSRLAGRVRVPPDPNLHGQMKIEGF